MYTVSRVMNDMKNSTHGGNIYKKAKELGLREDQILDYSANISPLGIPAHIKKAMVDAIEGSVNYPDPDCTALREAIGRQDGVEPGAVACGNGGADLLYRLAFGLKPEKVLLPVPAFVEYEEAMTAAGALPGSFLRETKEETAMEICGKREFELLEKIGFTRIAGSPEELQAAEILKSECDAMGAPAVIEPFEIEQGIVEEATLEILEPFQQEIPVTGYQCAENTPEGGLVADFLYVEDGDEVSLSQAKGKIVLVNGFLRVPLFRKLMKAGVAGIVTMEGELRDKREETDLSTRKLRRTLRAFGNVPLVHTRVLDAIELVRKGASKARIVLKGRTDPEPGPA